MSVRLGLHDGYQDFQATANGGLQVTKKTYDWIDDKKDNNQKTQPVNLKTLKNVEVENIDYVMSIHHDDYNDYNPGIDWQRDSTSNIKQKWKKTHISALRWQTSNYKNIQAYQRRRNKNNNNNNNNSNIKNNNHNNYKPNNRTIILARDLMNVLQQARRAPSKPKRTGNFKMLYRGITGAAARKLMTVGVIADKGFIATTPELTIAQSFATQTGVTMRINMFSIPAGTPWMWIPQDFTPAMWMNYVQVVLPPGELTLSQVQTNSKFVDVTYRALPISVKALPDVRTLPIDMQTLPVNV